MRVEFYIDSDTGQPHIAGHGVETWEAIDVLENAEVDYNGKRGTRIAVGQTREGRYLRVIYRRLDTDSRRVITAMDLPAKARKSATPATPEKAMKKTPRKSSRLSQREDALVAEFYDEQTDDEVVAEIEAAVQDPKTVMVQVPRSLLPEILKLIDQKKKIA